MNAELMHLSEQPGYVLFDSNEPNPGGKLQPGTKICRWSRTIPSGEERWLLIGSIGEDPLLCDFLSKVGQ